MMLHLHDNNGYITGAGEEDQYLLPLDGTIDWKETMRGIYNAGYRGAVALEVTNLGYERLNAGEFLQIAYERAKRLEKLYNGVR